MRKERKGPLGAVAGLAEDLVATMRRRQRGPRAARGASTTPRDSPGWSPTATSGTRLLDLAEDMVALVGGERE